MPVAITYLNATHITDSLYAAAVYNPSILLNVYSEAVLGSYYTYAVTAFDAAGNESAPVTFTVTAS